MQRNGTMRPAAVVAAALAFAWAAAVDSGRARTQGVSDPGDLVQGQAIFQRQRAACHSLQAGVHRFGPSLAGLFGRVAGSVEGFHGYSAALKSAGVVWDAQTLDRWLKAPRRFIPETRMAFPGLTDSLSRRDLIAYLRATAAPRRPKKVALGIQTRGVDGKISCFKTFVRAGTDEQD
jgi:cytochrome c